MFDMDNEIARVHATILREELGAILEGVATVTNGQLHNRALDRATILRQRIDQLEATNWRSWRRAPTAQDKIVAALRTAWQALVEMPVKPHLPLRRSL